MIKQYELVVSFPASNVAYVQLCKSQNAECLLEAMQRIFEYIGKIPTCILFDNMSSAVAKILPKRERKLTDSFSRFVFHHKFKAVFCNPNKGQEKGNVENKVGYERRNYFVPVPIVTDLEEYNKKLLIICDKVLEPCKQLHLSSNILENAKVIKKDNNLDLLLELFTLELQNRQVKRTNVYIKSARFDVLKTFEGYSFNDIIMSKSITEHDILYVNFNNKKENLILYGNVGSGKTHLAIATGIAACSHGKRVKFNCTATLVNALIDAKRQGNIVKFMRSIEKCDLLICDEWGYVPVDSVGSKLLFQVIAECYERKSLIITTNLEFSKWNEIFFDEKIIAAIIDRIIHHSHLLDFSNRYSRRLLDSLIKLK